MCVSLFSDRKKTTLINLTNLISNKHITFHSKCQAAIGKPTVTISSMRLRSAHSQILACSWLKMTTQLCPLTNVQRLPREDMCILQ